MARIAIIIALLLTMVVTIKGIAVTWRDKAVVVAGKAPTEQKTPPPVVPAPPRNPPVATPLPDLKAGYLFNPERSLVASAEPAAPTEVVVAESGEEKTPGVKMEDVTYVGSVIGETFKKALISFPAPAAQGAPGASPSRAKGGRSGATGGSIRGGGATPMRLPTKNPLAGGGPRPTPAATPRGGNKSLTHLQLVEGDLVNGYKLSGIFNDKLLFVKGSEQIEKKIYDANKQRPVPAAPPPVANVPRPDAQGNLPPSPMPGMPPITVPPETPADDPQANQNPNEGPGQPAAATPPPAEMPPPEPIRKMTVTRPAAPSIVNPDPSTVVRGLR